MPGSGKSSVLDALSTLLEVDEVAFGAIEIVAAESVLVACLTASPELAAARVARREPDAWPGKPALVEHARKLAREIPLLSGIDVVLSASDRDPVDVATEIRELLATAGIVRPTGRRESHRSPSYRG